MTMTQNPLSVLRLTLFSEAGGETADGIRAVASVIWNRSHGDPSRLSDVCLYPKQFSCWDNHTPRRGSGKSWNLCVQVASDMLAGRFDPTGSWNHYWNPSMCDPSWAHEAGDVSKPLLPHDEIGRHFFVVLGSWPGRNVPSVKAGRTT
jgi:spore germination cell wall hydrolase CwlJ-like protein